MTSKNWKLLAAMAAAAGLTCTASAQLSSVRINEVRVDQTGTDNDEYFELAGPAGQSLVGLTYLVIGDGTGGSGVIEAVITPTGSIQADGLYLASETTLTLGVADELFGATGLNFENNDNLTHLIVTGFTGSNGQDLDTNDDGILDITPWTAVIDAIALVQAVAGPRPGTPPTGNEWYYEFPGSAVIGPDGTFLPAHVYRFPNLTGSFNIGPFDPTSGVDTPGNPNNAPTLGACCVANLSCTFVSAGDCAFLGGVWTANQTCVQVNCPPTGSCCLPNGNCSVTIQTSCTAAGAVWTAGNTCTPNICPQPAGACCVALVCTIENFANCQTAGGVWLGFGAPCSPLPCNPASGPNLVAKYDFDVNRVGIGNNLTYSQTPAAGAFTSAADGFEPYQRYTGESIPFSVLDDSTSIFLGDALGVIREDKVDRWFGANDLTNPDNLGGTGTVTFTFDISGFNNLSFSGEFAAMGDFESINCSTPPCFPDQYAVNASIDGGPTQQLAFFETRETPTTTVNYTLAGGTIVPLDDPLFYGPGATDYLTNVFTTRSAPIAGTGNVLTLTITMQSDGDEAFVFDNLMIMGDVAGNPCPLDLSGNGIVDADDIFAFLNIWFAGPPGGSCVTPPTGCPGDWNNDGQITADDIFAYLNDWFAFGPGQACP